MRRLFCVLATLVSPAAALAAPVLNPFTGKLQLGSISITSSTLPSGSTNYIQNKDTFQTGATFYTASGTVNGPFYVNGNAAAVFSRPTQTISDASMLTLRSRYDTGLFATAGTFLGLDNLQASGSLSTFIGFYKNGTLKNVFGTYDGIDGGDSKGCSVFSNSSGVSISMAACQGALTFGTANSFIGIGSGFSPTSTLDIRPLDKSGSGVGLSVRQGSSIDLNNIQNWNTNAGVTLSSISYTGQFYAPDVNAKYGVTMTTGSATGSGARFDVFNSNATLGDTLLKVGSNQLTDQLVIADQQAPYFRIGLRTGGLYISTIDSSRINALSATNTLIEFYNATDGVGSLTFQTGLGSGEDLIFKPAISEALRISGGSGALFTSSATFKSASGTSFRYGVAAGSTTGSGLSTCGDATHALNYDGPTGLFGCQVIASGGGGASSLAVTTGTSAGFSNPPVSSPTATALFDQGNFNVALQGGATAFITLRNGLSSVTGNFTLGSTSTVVLADAAGAALTVTLPTAAGIAGKIYTVKRTNSGINSVTIATTSSQTIDGATTQVLTLQYTSLDLISDGSNWSIL